MAELAALGLAGNIIQFVDFGIKLLGNGRELYRSATGNTAEDLEIETVTGDLKILSQHLYKPLQPNRIVSADEAALQNLAVECEKLATKLLSELDKLKVKDEGSRKWKSFKKALARVMKENEIQELEDRLARFQKQINQRLLHMMRSVFLMKKRMY
jgi:hypothetical protein